MHPEPPSSCSPPFALCDTLSEECNENDLLYPDNCKCQDKDFPDDWVDCKDVKIVNPPTIPKKLIIPTEIYIGTHILESKFGGDLKSAEKRIMEVWKQMERDTFKSVGIYFKKVGEIKQITVEPPYDMNALEKLKKTPLLPGGYTKVAFVTDSGGLGTIGAYPIF